MRCSEVEALWDERRDRDARDGDATVVDHLRACPRCRSVFEANDLLLHALLRLSDAPPPRDFCARIKRRVDAACGVEGPPVTIARLATPIGDLVIGFDRHAVAYLALDQGESAAVVAERVARRLGRSVRADAPAPWVARLVEEYFSTWTVDLDRLDLSRLSAFERRTLRVAAGIPPGHVRSYGWIARQLGDPNAARAVGRVMARNPIALLLPCHRVVDARGNLHHYAFGVAVKARLLQMEGYAPEPAGRP